VNLAWRALVTELKFVVRTFIEGAKKAFLTTTALVVVFTLLSMFRGEFDITGAMDVVVLLIVAVAYGAYVGAFVGLVFGSLWLAWKTVGPWMFVPLLLTPLTVALAFWGMWGLLENQTIDVGAALLVAGAEHDWMLASLGPAARIGPPILIIALPILVVDLGLVVLTPGVLWELFVLAFDLCLVLAVGVFPALLCSAVVLPIAYVRRYRMRTKSPTAPAS